jgi:tripartite-type tricarboxylate transporter receptor subunit TctC
MHAFSKGNTMSMKILSRGCAAAALALLGASASLPAHADNFPVRAVQVVIPFQPGDTDNLLRPFTDKMGEFLGQPVVLNYRPGAGGGVGAAAVAGSKPDGYTLVGTSPGSIVVVPLANKDIKYTTESFAPVASLVEGGLMILVASNSPWKSMQELVQYSQKSPEKINFSSSGAMGITHLLAEIFAKEAGIRWTHIPMQGSGPAITGLLGGHVQMASSALAPALSHVKAGTLRPLATFGDARLKAFPDVPTLRELGYNFGSPVYYGILAPKGTPREVVDALYGAVRKAVDKHGAEITERLKVFGSEIKLLGPEEYAQYLRTQSRLFSVELGSLR